MRSFLRNSGEISKLSLNLVPVLVSFKKLFLLNRK